jgi:hypothetical protein
VVTAIATSVANSLALGRLDAVRVAPVAKARGLVTGLSARAAEILVSHVGQDEADPLEVEDLAGRTAGVRGLRTGSRRSNRGLSQSDRACGDAEPAESSALIAIRNPTPLVTDKAGRGDPGAIEGDLCHRRGTLVPSSSPGIAA